MCCNMVISQVYHIIFKSYHYIILWAQPQRSDRHASTPLHTCQCTEEAANERERERQRGREAERQRGREAERRRGGEAERWRRAPQMCDARALSPRAGARAPRLPHLGGDQRGDGADWDVSKTGFSKAGFMDVCSVTFDVSVYAMGAPRVD